MKTLDGEGGEVTGCIGIGWTRTFSFFFPSSPLGDPQVRKSRVHPRAARLAPFTAAARRRTQRGSGCQFWRGSREWSVCRANTNRVGGGGKEEDGRYDIPTPPPSSFLSRTSYVSDRQGRRTYGIITSGHNGKGGKKSEGEVIYFTLLPASPTPRRGRYEEEKRGKCHQRPPSFEDGPIGLLLPLPSLPISPFAGGEGGGGEKAVLHYSIPSSPFIFPPPLLIRLLSRLASNFVCIGRGARAGTDFIRCRRRCRPFLTKARGKNKHENSLTFLPRRFL